MRGRAGYRLLHVGKEKKRGDEKKEEEPSEGREEKKFKKLATMKWLKES